MGKWDPTKQQSKLQFEDASENEYTLVGKMNRLQWMNWCVRPEKHKELFGLRWLFTWVGQWWDRMKAFTDGPFKEGKLYDCATGNETICEPEDETDTGERTVKRSITQTVTREKNFFGGRNVQSNSFRPYFSSLCDLSEHRVIEQSDAEALAARLKIPYFET